MPDSDSSPPVETAKQGGGYPIPAAPATPSLTRILQEEIRENGAISFTRFMEVALYEPAAGYYARGTGQVGREGDFFTSVSVGPLFGELLARRFLREWQESGSPEKWRVIECGAHDGKLAHDILGTIQTLDSQAFDALEYVIPEPLPALQAGQRTTLEPFIGQVRFMDDVASLSEDPLQGIALGNELLDALPFHVVEWQSGSWHECRVDLDESGKFTWGNHPVASPGLAEALRRLGTGFPDGYRTEVRTNYGDFLHPLTRALSSGLLLWIDYGFARPEYYHPDRTTGTLRTFARHRAAEDPLVSPGEMDITAHVDFTAVAEAAQGLGCRPILFQNQGTWLTTTARDWLLAMEGTPDPSALRQFQTLVHPGHLGRNFHVIELSWHQPGRTLPAADFHRLALQACPEPPGN